MKKQLLALAMIGTGILNAQTWSQNFSSATAPGLPAGWMQNNVDAKTVVSNLSSWNFGTNAWVTRDVSASYPTYGKVVASTSWYNPVGIANDWLITPSFTVPANAVLQWDAIALDASFADGYQVKVSTTGTLTGDFSTNLLTVSAENPSWTNRGLNLNAYAGQTVYIAFVNNSNDKYLLLMDNIQVLVPQAEDGNVLSITGLSRYIAGAGNQTIQGVFKSVGYNPASTAVLHYSINNGAAVTQTFTFGTPLSYGQTTNYSFSTQGALALGVNKIKVWVSNVNGVAETALANDTAMTTVYVASTTKPRNALVEEFTSSTCVPCANLNATFDPLLNSNNPNTGGDVNVVKYQVNWPSPGNDPSYNAHGDNRVDHYKINAAPTAITNGRTEMSAHSQAEINAAKAEPAFAEGVATLTLSGNVLTGNITFTPYVGIPTNSPLRLHQVLLQQYYNYPGATTTQKNYYHVMRKMNPNGWGAPVTTVDGQALNGSFTHTVQSSATPAQMSFNFWTTTNIVYEYVAFIQDSVSNHILNTASANFSVTGVGLVDLAKDQKIGVYPNPAKDFAVVGIKLEKSSNVDMVIYDVTGKVVYTNNGTTVDAGGNEIMINTSEFATGTYTIVVKTAEGILKEKLIVVK